MPGNILWQSGAVISYAAQLSGQGPQLTNGTIVQCSGDFFNNGVSGGPCFFGFAELVTSQSGFGAALNDGNNLDLYLVPSRDGTNVMDVGLSGNIGPASHFKGSFLTVVSGNAQMRLGVDNIPLLPVRYRPYIKNNTGQTLASGWTLFINAYNQAYT